MADLDVVNRIAEVLGTSSATAVSEYGLWYLTSSVLWISIGVGILLFGLWWHPKHDEHEDRLIGAIKAGLIFIGLLFIAANVPDLVAPKAAAIHRIIEDVRG